MIKCLKGYVLEELLMSCKGSFMSFEIDISKFMFSLLALYTTLTIFSLAFCEKDLA